MSSQEMWNLIAQCFPQDTIDIMETIVLGKRGEEGLPRVPLQGLLLTEIMRCLRASAPDVGSGYNKSDTLAGNLVRQTKTLIPETREAAIAMQKDIRAIMNVCPEDIKKSIDTVRAEFRVWAAGMKAPAQLDDGGALSLKTKFVNFIKFGSHNKEIEDYKEVGERLLTWAKIRCEPVEAYQNHMGTLYKPLQAIESREKRRDTSQPRPMKRTRDDSEDMHEKKRQARSRERSRERAKERSRERARDKSRERAREKSRERARDKSRERARDRSRERAQKRHRSPKVAHTPGTMRREMNAATGTIYSRSTAINMSIKCCTYYGKRHAS